MERLINFQIHETKTVDVFDMDIAFIVAGYRNYSSRFTYS